VNAIEDLLCGHIRDCREKIAAAVSSVDALEHLVKRLGDPPPAPQPVPRPHQSGWSEEEDNLLRDYYPSIGGRCGQMLPRRSQWAIRGRAHKLGLSCVESLKRTRCDQCDANVTMGQVAACQSKFCPGKVRA
jgi:hypothetical protein